MVKYLGIDIGDGESAAAMVQENGAVLPKVLSLGTTKSILSVVGERNGKPVIGDQALLNPGVENIRARFKSRFLSDPSASVPIATFARGLRELLSGVLSGQDELQVALGCPAGWTSSERQQYAALVGAAGFPNLHTVAESRAAFLYAHYDKDIGLSPEELSQPALVVDIGSSTTDFAYIVEGKETELGVFGDVRLGGGLLDQLILEDAVRSSGKEDKFQAVFAQFPSWRSFCELECRKAKEAFFSDEEAWKDQSYVRRASVFADVSSVLTLTIRLDGARMRQLLETPIPELGNRTFPDKLRQALSQAVQNTAAHPPQQLILTGGASRMAFFREACKEAFPNANVTVCKDPEYCIARGLSIAARVDNKLRAFRQEIERFFESKGLSRDISLHLPALQTKLSPILVKRIMTNCVEPAAKAEFSTLEQLQTAIQDNVKQEFAAKGHTPETDAVLADWIANELKDTQASIDTICQASDVERADLSLAKLGLNVRLDKLSLLPPLLPQLVTNVILKFVFHQIPSLMKSAVQNALNRELTAANGSFAQGLATSLEAELRTQIQANAEKVEIHIS